MKFRRTALTPTNPIEKIKNHCVMNDSQLEARISNDEGKEGKSKWGIFFFYGRSVGDACF